MDDFGNKINDINLLVDVKQMSTSCYGWEGYQSAKFNKLMITRFNLAVITVKRLNFLKSFSQQII